MTQQYSIAEARDRLPGIVHEVEDGAPVELTRRGKPVAVIVSIDDFRRMSSKRPDFWELYQQWRQSGDPSDLEGDDPFANVRDRSPGRDFEW